MGLCSYDPENISGPLNTPPDTGPTLTVETNVVFTGVGDPVTLRVPDFGDTKTLDQKRIIRRTRQGNLIVTRDQSERETEALSIVISYSTEAQAAAFRSFVLANLGLFVTYTDYEGRDWSVIIINPQEVINHDMYCSQSMRVQMRGALA